MDKTFLIAVALNAGVKGLMIRWVFKFKVDRRKLGWLVLANGITVGLALASYFAEWPDM